MSQPNTSRKLNRYFIRKAMEIELEITPEELVELWALHRGVDTSSEEDLDVDGIPMGTDWDQPVWEDTKKAALQIAMGAQKASPLIDMIAAVHQGELLGALDARKRGADDVRFWSFKLEGPFELYRLEDVSMSLAQALADFPRGSRLGSPKNAWSMAKKHAEGRPFKKKI